MDSVASGYVGGLLIVRWRIPDVNGRWRIPRMQMLVCRVIETANVITYAEVLASRLVFHCVLCLELRSPGVSRPGGDERVLTMAIAKS